MSSLSAHLACPAVRWLGIHPSDIKRLSIDSQPMSPADVHKANHLLARPYAKGNVLLQKEVAMSLLIRFNNK